VQILQSARLFASNLLWRTTGSSAAARTLVSSLGSTDPGVRTIAGMFLVQAGKKAEPLIEEAIREKINLPQVLVMAGDVGAKRLEPQLRRFLTDPDPEISRAAREGLKILAAHDSGSAS
jgi:HEAT repeat protein